MGAWHQDGLANWLSVVMWLWLDCSHIKRSFPKAIRGLEPIVTEERYWALFYMALVKEGRYWALLYMPLVTEERNRALFYMPLVTEEHNRALFYMPLVTEERYWALFYMPSVTEERYWALFYMPFYKFLYNLLNVLIQTANKMGTQKLILKSNIKVCILRNKHNCVTGQNVSSSLFLTFHSSHCFCWNIQSKSRFLFLQVLYKMWHP
jgi:hypothetical protein